MANSTLTEPFVCAFYNPDFIIYSSLGSFYIPCLVMIVLYTRIFKVSSCLDLSQGITSVSQTLHARAQNKSRSGLSLGCLPSATAIQPAALCRKVTPRSSHWHAIWTNQQSALQQIRRREKPLLTFKDKELMPMPTQAKTFMKWIHHFLCLLFLMNYACSLFCSDLKLYFWVRCQYPLKFSMNNIYLSLRNENWATSWTRLLVSRRR